MVHACFFYKHAHLACMVKSEDVIVCRGGKKIHSLFAEFAETTIQLFTLLLVVFIKLLLTIEKIITVSSLFEYMGEALELHIS